MAADPNWKVPPPLAIKLSAKQDKANPGDVEGNAERIKQALSELWHRSHHGRRQYQCPCDTVHNARPARGKDEQNC
jgi:hypothetical protein